MPADHGAEVRGQQEQIQIRRTLRDFIPSSHDTAEQCSIGKLENLGARRPEEFDLRELHDRLDTPEWVSDTECEAYGLDAARISSLRQ